MGLELELAGGAEGRGVHLHEALAVAAGVQAVHRVLDDVQALVPRCLQVVLGRQVGAQRTVQASMVAQVTALVPHNTHKHTQTYTHTHTVRGRLYCYTSS